MSGGSTLLHSTVYLNNFKYANSQKSWEFYTFGLINLPFMDADISFWQLHIAKVKSNS